MGFQKNFEMFSQRLRNVFLRVCNTNFALSGSRVILSSLKDEAVVKAPPEAISPHELRVCSANVAPGGVPAAVSQSREAVDGGLSKLKNERLPNLDSLFACESAGI